MNAYYARTHTCIYGFTGLDGSTELDEETQESRWLDGDLLTQI
jgi:hypothetical protein